MWYDRLFIAAAILFLLIAAAVVFGLSQSIEGVKYHP